MHLRIETKVSMQAEAVFERFDRDLFLALNPPFPPVRLLQFGGCKTGDQVEIELNFLAFRQTWISDITDHGDTGDEIYFIDEGRKLPFFLSYWRHRHVIRRAPHGSTIIDDIEFRAPSPPLTALFYPALYGQFLYRKPIYRRWFGKPKG